MKIGRILDPTPNWEHSDPNTRLQALESRVPPDDVLARLAQNDSDNRIREKAASYVSDHELLVTLSRDEDAAVAEAAAQRWVEIFIDAAPDAAGDTIARLENQRLLASVACHAESVELRLQSVSRVADSRLLEVILERDNHANVHQACASQVSDEDEQALEQLLRRFRGKDKNVTRILRQKLDDIHARRAASMALQDQCLHIRDTLEHLATDKHHDLFERRFAVLNDQWRSLIAEHGEEIDAALTTAIETARHRCEEIIETMHRQREEQDAVARQAVEQLEALTQRLGDGPDVLATISGALDEIRARWPVGFAEDHDLTRHFYELLGPLENLAAQYALCEKLPGEGASTGQLQSALEKISWPDDWPAPARLAEARQQLQTLQDAEAKQKAQVERELAQINDQLQRLEQTIGEGKLKPASKLHNSLKKRFETATIQIPRDQKDQLARLAQQLHELQDWQGFVTLPKRTELCEQMETLRDDAAIPPPEKARAIKDLQQRWKNLGPSNHRQSQQLWTRFKEAADAAFAPCAEYFAAQRQVREQNLAERQKICDELDALYAQTDWDGEVDWKTVNDVFIKARRQWRQYDDIPHARRKKIQSRFSKLIKQFEAKLGEEQERNHEAKRALIEQVKAMLADENMDLSALIHETKQAQTAWKDIGITDRKTDQRLWKAFREQCDAVFQRRDAEGQRQRESTNAAKSAARDVSNKLKQMVANKDIDRSQLRKIRSEFEAVAPNKESADVKKEFNRHLRDAEKALREQASASWREMLDEVRRKADLCLKLEKGEISAEAAEAAWASEVEVDPALLSELEARRAAAGTTDEATLAANLAAAALLCVRIEIMAELPSPPEAQSLRMQYQVDRLNRELSQGQKETRSPAQQLRDLQVEWYSLGALPDDSDGLRERFQRAEEKLGA